MAIVKKIYLVKSDPVHNNNKFWLGELDSNGDVTCRWGRVGDTGQSKVFPGAGDSFLMKKVNEKKRDGRNGEIAYQESEIIDAAVMPKSSPAITVKDASLSKIAKEQIKTSSSEAAKLIDYLVKVNAHSICAASGGNITYNFETGMFQTPLGLVSQATVDRARLVLNDIADLVKVKRYDDALLGLTRSYLMLIPTNIGRARLETPVFWSGLDKVQAQNAILDGLQASLVKATTPKDAPATDKKEVVEKVFDTQLDIVTDQALITKIFDNYLQMRSSQHNSYHYKPKNLWTVHIAPMRKAFDGYGRKLDNNIEGYHGTGSSNILSLLKTGFLVRPPKNAAISGKMFGDGTYVAPCHIKGSATKALNYSIGTWAGAKSDRTFMFICDVGMGKWYLAPDACYNGIPKGYDSCWAKAGKTKSWHGTLANDECVVYKESQIDIKFLMELG